MYDIKMLEDEWKHYNRKKRRPFIFVIILLLIIGISSLFLKDIQLHSTPVVKDQKVVVSNVDHLIKNIKLDGSLNEILEKEISVSAPTPLVEVLPDEENTDSVESAPKGLDIHVVEADNTKAFKEVEKRFRLGHDVDDSLFLAKAYYDKKLYKKAEYWALQTNKVDNNIEESWLIFIKSKIKRGQKNEAKRILNTYIKRTNSAEAKVLLEKIKKGKF